MILEPFACGALSITEFIKTQQYSLEENTEKNRNIEIGEI